MKVPVIKKMVDQFSMEELTAAEEAFLNEQKPEIDIVGEDEGEQLTHVLAAIEIKRDMEKNSVSSRDALRNYSVRVRNSIC